MPFKMIVPETIDLERESQTSLVQENNFAIKARSRARSVETGSSKGRNQISTSSC